MVYTLNYVKIKDLSEDKRVQSWFNYFCAFFLLVTVRFLLDNFRDSDCFWFSCANHTNVGKGIQCSHALGSACLFEQDT